MLDPDNFHEGDDPATVQMKRIACTLDIQARYAQHFEAILAKVEPNKSLQDYPDLFVEWERLMEAQKKEMDERFANLNKKPVVIPIERTKTRKIKNPRVLTPNTFLFHAGVRGRYCAYEKCGKLFIPSGKHRKYCSHACEDLSRKERFSENRRKKKEQGK